MKKENKKQYELYERSVSSRGNERPQTPVRRADGTYAAQRDPNNPVDRLFINQSGKKASNYTGDKESERDYRPIRQSHEYRSGCLGGMMYFVFVICLSVVLACLGWMAASDVMALNKKDFHATVTLPMSIFDSETVEVRDEEGNLVRTKRVTHADIDYMADMLKDAGLIEYKWLFTAFCRLSHADTKVVPGEYELHSTYDYRALIQHMSPFTGGAVTVTVTFPEGMTMDQMFLLMEQKGVSTYSDLMEAAANYRFNYSFLEELSSEQLELLRLDKPSYLEKDQSQNTYDFYLRSKYLEGYLFPNTYEFYVNMEPASAINKFLETFHTSFNSDMMTEMEQSGRDIREIVTIASMIEKEAANDEERPLIASVIYNRLHSNSPLGIDATILYVHPEHEGAPTTEMLSEDSLYNTRDRIGLPPTPICNPGLASLKAALEPATTDYYYYALDTETGTHRFFTNMAEFNAFVATQNYGG
ncbi:MAG: endolytic transglycosylase MltG [Oscillospiraceae bacterium]|nr:endolytic transglycosylase MltG [Oscillospiraceae bacterium]